MLKSSEVVGQMKLQRRYAKVHQHSRKGRKKDGWSMLLPILNSTCSYFSKLTLQKTKNNLLQFPTQVSEFSLLGKPPVRKRKQKRRKYLSTRIEFPGTLWNLGTWRSSKPAWTSLWATSHSFKVHPDLRRTLDLINRGLRKFFFCHSRNFKSLLIWTRGPSVRMYKNFPSFS